MADAFSVTSDHIKSQYRTHGSVHNQVQSYTDPILS